MASASSQVNTLGRGPNLACIPAQVAITVTASATAYATASGGLPFDLTTALQTASAGMIPSGQAPNYTQTINPADILGVVLSALSTNKFMPLNFAVGTPTYTAVPWQSDNGVAATPGILATCPCTIRLWGGSAGSGLAFAEFADGNNSDSFTMQLQINRNGANN